MPNLPTDIWTLVADFLSLQDAARLTGGLAAQDSLHNTADTIFLALRSIGNKKDALHVQVSAIAPKVSSSLICIWSNTTMMLQMMTSLPSMPSNLQRVKLIAINVFLVPCSDDVSWDH
jgi:hypothetical protein